MGLVGNAPFQLQDQVALRAIYRYLLGMRLFTVGQVCCHI